MKYAVLYGPRDLRLDEKPVPDIKPGRVLVKIAACGICGTDAHIYTGKIPVKLPYSPGHECAGTVHEAGAGVLGVKSGDRVAIDPNHDCGFCYYCRRGYPHLCENQKTLKVKSNGGFAEYIMVPEKLVHKIPDHVSFQEAALIETLSCCIHIIAEAGIRTGDTVAIMGGGAMGLMLVQLARQKGAGQIVVSEPVEFKRKLVVELGADRGVDPLNEDLPATVRQMNPYGANVVIEGVGLPAAIEQAFNMLARRGTLVLAGLCPENKTVPVCPYRLTRDEINVKGAFLNPFSFARAIDCLGHIDKSKLITGTYPLSAVAEAMEAAQGGNHVKIVINPDME